MNIKKVSIDFHGVINSNPKFFSEFFELLQAKGVEVYVTSGGPQKFVERYLLLNNIPYNHIWCIFDHFNKREKIELSADGSFRIDDKLWNTAKSRFCAHENIDIHIDDSVVYGRYFTTPYVLFNMPEQCFIIGKEKISIAENMEFIWQALLKYLQT